MLGWVIGGVAVLATLRAELSADRRLETARQNTTQSVHTPAKMNLIQLQAGGHHHQPQALQQSQEHIK